MMCPLSIRQDLTARDKIKAGKTRMKHRLRCVLAALLVLALLTAPVSALEPEGDHQCGICIVSAPPEENRVTYVPLRSFLDALGIWYSLEWNQQYHRAFVYAWGLSLSVGEGDRYLKANDRCLYLYGSCYLLNDRLMVPLQPLAQACGVEAVWDERTREVRLSGKYSPILSGEDFYDETDLYWLSRIIYAEAGIECFDGQVAVGNVVLNRMARRSWPDTVYEVVFDDRFGVQFTPASTGTIYQEPSAQAIAAAKVAMEGVDLVEDSLYFVNESVSSCTWFRECCIYVTSIGRHSFYTEEIQ